MNRRQFVLAMAASSLSSTGRAQTGTRLPRIGILSLRRTANNPLNQALMQGLREYGYVDGSTCVIDQPDADGREERFPVLAAELVKRNPDVVLVIGPAPLPAVRRATQTIPLVMVASSPDPVAEGIARSLSVPGGNITGLTYAEPDRFKKQLELLKSLAPGLRRVSVLWDFDEETYRRLWRAPLADAGRILSIAIAEPAPIRTSEELPAAIASIKERADGFIIAAGGATSFTARSTIARLAIEHRLPAIAAFREFVEDGLLMSHGPDLPEINRRAGAYVARILKGEKPANLPIQLPDRFQLFINRKTASGLGLAIPSEIQARADGLI